MKGLLKFTSAALAVAALASCTSDDLLGISGNGVKTNEKAITATIENVAGTRVAVGVASDGSRGLVFSGDDKLNVYTLSSTKYDTYALEEGENTDKATFTPPATPSFDLKDGDDYYGVIWNVGARIYGLSPAENGKPLLTMNIPAKYTYNTTEGAEWGDGKTGEAYKMPLPLWGKVSASDDELSVDFKYLTGVLKINVVNLRAGSKAIRVTSEKEPISGFFNAVLDPETPEKLVADPEALVAGNTLTVELPGNIVYEAVDTVVYLPLIAQRYTKLTVDVLDEKGNLMEQLAEIAGKTIERGQYVAITRSMTVTDGSIYGNSAAGTNDISSKLYELTSKNGTMPIKMQLNGKILENQTIIIDKAAKSESITLEFVNAIPSGLKIVEGTPDGKADEKTGIVKWTTEVTGDKNNSATVNHTVNIVYNKNENNQNDMELYLPNSHVTISATGTGTSEYTGGITALTALAKETVDKDGELVIVPGLKIDETAAINHTDKGLTVLKDGDVVVEGFVNNLWQKGNGNVTVKNLTKTMKTLEMGTAAEPVRGNLTVTGGNRPASTNMNSASVVTLGFHSTGAFAADKLDGAASATWTFDQLSSDAISINNDNVVTYVEKVNVSARNNLTLNNVVIGTYNYTANKKATVTANAKSAIVKLDGDKNDMLSISSTWDGSSVSNTTLFKNKRGISAAEVISGETNEIHTAYQLAALTSNTSKVANLKGTTVIDLTTSKEWIPITASAEQKVEVNGDCNGNGESVAVIKNLTVSKKINSGVPVGLFGTINFSKDSGNEEPWGSIKNLRLENTSLSNNNEAGALVGKFSAPVSLSGVHTFRISGVTVDNANVKAGVNPAGGLIGNVVNATGTDKLQLIITDTEVTGEMKALYMGGMIGKSQGTVQFGNGTTEQVQKAAATVVNATFELDDNYEPRNVEEWGSVNTYVGRVESGKVIIIPFCKHGAVVQKAKDKKALNFDKNVIKVDDGINTNYWYFWSGNPWVGVVSKGVEIQFPDKDNVLKEETKDGEDYNVRKTLPLYVDESYSDWDE